VTNEGAEYNLVMPFVTCRSTGGPHDDASYVAGYEMGKLDAVLNISESTRMALRPTVYAQLHTDNVPQADLLAMRYGYRARFEQVEGFPNWTAAEFSDSTIEEGE
jgi:hypothetical protein